MLFGGGCCTVLFVAGGGAVSGGPGGLAGIEGRGADFAGKDREAAIPEDLFLSFRKLTNRKMS